MNIEIICIGSLKEPWLREAEKEYLKRLIPYLTINVIELPEKKLTKNASASDEEKIREAEGDAIINRAEKLKGAFVFAMDMRGKQFSSIELAKKVDELAGLGKSTLVFMIGGSLGFTEKVRQKADMILSFSELTFPHQMIRIILLEQLYRTQKILRGEPYHK